MRPTVFIRSSAAVSVAAAVLTSPAAAQSGSTNSRDRERDATARRRAETIVGAIGGNGCAYSIGDDRDRAVLGIMLGGARGRSDTLGVRITDVTPDGPAAKAGIEEGDRIVNIDGVNLRIDPADADDPTMADLASRRLMRALGKHKPGDEVSLQVMRGRELKSMRVKTVAADQLPNEGFRTFGFGPDGGTISIRGAESLRALRDSAQARAERRPALGVSVGVTGSARDTLGLFVSSVASDGPAEKAGLVEGSRIASIGGVDVRLSREDADDPEIASARARRFTRELEKHQPGDDIALRVWQNGAFRTLNVKAGKATEVWKGNSNFRFSFGDGGGDAIFLPPTTPMAPMAPIAPMRMMPAMPPMPATPRFYRLDGGSVRVLSAPGVRALTTPRAVVAPRVRRTIQM